MKNKIKEIIDYFYSNEFIHGPVDRLTVGDRVSKANTIFNTRSGTITVGNGVIFGHNCMVLTGLHNVTTRGSLKRRLTTENANNNILIEDGCWIGSGVIVLGNVILGKDCVIGAGSVITKNMPAGYFCAGNPCKIINKIKYIDE